MKHDNDIIKAVAAYYEITQADIIGPSTMAHHTEARYMVMHLAEKFLRLPHIRLTEMINRTHTVYYYYQAFIDANERHNKAFVRKRMELEAIVEAMQADSQLLTIQNNGQRIGIANMSHSSNATLVATLELALERLRRQTVPFQFLTINIVTNDNQNERSC